MYETTRRRRPRPLYVQNVGQLLLPVVARRPGNVVTPLRFRPSFFFLPPYTPVPSLFSRAGRAARRGVTRPARRTTRPVSFSSRHCTHDRSTRCRSLDETPRRRRRRRRRRGISRETYCRVPGGMLRSAPSSPPAATGSSARWPLRGLSRNRRNKRAAVVVGADNFRRRSRGVRVSAFSCEKNKHEHAYGCA